MPTEVPRALLEIRYYEAAQEYLRRLPLEHFMEAKSQATQRKITLESLDLVVAQRRDVHLFNELLVQCPLRGKKKPGQVVPDNMVVIHDSPIEAEGSYDVPLQPKAPYWVLEYLSKSNKRKDYEDNREKYEKHLKVPYYLTFYPEDQELTLYRYNGRKYVTVKPNDEGRYAVDGLEMEVALIDGWVRFWFRGQLLPLPADLLEERDEARRREEVQRRGRMEAEAEVTRLRAELDALRHRQCRERRPVWPSALLSHSNCAFEAHC